ncbi:hypothetical protein M427DRAFT_295021 [Gonapodya prolifera JEL478]|uniref:Uncharacterized protein n=1 Tax=Gonapodya prolifera (strain JEL478) TaxID=1344416 RepID=A0A139AHS3_GONPJ|nr:hypothetical protein M427DRAFT_295021 [Gonapodya prolifera JEL478]|eukprot:KXS16239.1 hypothetical protein M427DRAFT_295021 [Gonapodya prolifera JEL478]
MDWVLTFQVKGPSAEVLQRYEEEGEHWIVRGGVFDFAVPHTCTGHGHKIRLNPPTPSMVSTLWPAKKTNMYTFQPLNMDKMMYQLQMNDFKYDHHPSIHLDGRQCHLDIRHFNYLPEGRCRTSVERANDSDVVTPDGRKLKRPETLNPPDPRLEGTLQDLLGRHVHSDELEQDRHVWFGAIEKFQCTVRWMMGR